MRFCLSLFLLFGAVQSAFGAVQIPNGLNSNDRKEVVRILGFSTSSKILTDPYPLGGYAGFEFGVAVENLPVSDLSRLGNRLNTSQQDVTYAKFTLGKGLYNNLDIFFNFVPYSQRNEISQYGGIARWGFYQAPLLPFSLSILASGTSTVFSSRLTTLALTTDIIGGVNVDEISIFAGGGYIQANGYFNGGPSGLTDSQGVENDFVSGSHFLLGGNVKFEKFLFTMQIDRYTQTIFSAKTAYRF